MHRVQQSDWMRRTYSGRLVVARKNVVICAVCVVELLSSARYDEVLTRVLCVCVCVCDNPETNTELR